MLEINKLQKKYENFELNCSMEQEKVQHLKRFSAL